MSTSDVTASVADAAAPAGLASLEPSALISAITSGSADPFSLLLSQLGGQSADNPTMAVLSRLLEQRRASIVEPETATEEDALTTSNTEFEQQERDRRLAELKEIVERVYAELEILRARNDALAAGVGACFLCFGADPRCEECGGLGVPGSRAPEPAAYREFVAPAVARIQKSRARAGTRIAPQRPAPPLVR